MSNARKKILLTDGHYKHTLGLARHLTSNGWEVWALGNPFSENRFSKYFKYVPKILDGSNQTIDFIHDLTSVNGIDCVLPVGANSVNFFSKNRTQFSGNLTLLLPSHNTITTAFDKLKMVELAVDLRVGAPQTLTAHEWKKSKSELRDNFIIKSRNEFLDGCKTKYFGSQLEGEIYLSAISESILDNLVVQENISGTGEAFFAIYNQGKLLTSYTHKRIREMPLSGGSSTCAETTENEDTFQLGKRILDSLNWHGPAMVEFKRDSLSKNLFLMEVNPKLWGSLELGISHGVQFSNAIESILNNQAHVLRESRHFVRFQWPFHGDLMHLRERNLRMSILTDFLNFKVKKNIYVSDPLPLILKPIIIGAKFLLEFRPMRVSMIFLKRIQKQGIRIAFLRFIEETFGLPTSKPIVLNGYFLVGPQLSRFGKIILGLRGFTASINLQSEFNDAENGLTLENHLHIPCIEYESLSNEKLLEGVIFLHLQVKQTRKIYIHCREGVSRAPYLLAAYFVSLGYSVEESYKLIAGQRTFINPLEVHKMSIDESVDLLRRNIY